MRLNHRLVAMLAVAATALSSIPSTHANPAGDYLKSSAGSVELTDLRTRHSKTFQNPNGTRRWSASQGSVHFVDERGTWQDIDTDIVPLAAAPYAYGMTRNAYHSFFAADVAGPVAAKFETARWSVSFGLNGGCKGAVDVQGNRITYVNALPGVDLRFTTREDELREELVLDRRPASAQWEFALNLHGVRLETGQAGTLDFVDIETGQRVWFMPKPFMFDAAGARSEAVTKHLVERDGRTCLVVKADASWLAAPGRAYPVTVDPTWSASTPSADTYISGTLTGNNYGGLAYMRTTGTGYATYGYCQSLIAWDMAGAPPASAVVNGDNSCSISARCVSATAALAHNVSCYPVTGSWTESGVTWNNKPATGALYATTSVGASSAVYSWGWNGFNNVPDANGVLLALGSSDTWTGTKNWDTKESANQKPGISITYIPAPVFSTEPPATASANVGDSVSWTVAASDANGNTMSYAWYKNAASFGGSEYSGINTDTLTINPVNAGDGATYTCVATGPSGSTTSGGCIFTVNSGGLATPTVTVTDNKSGSSTAGDSVTFTATVTGGNNPGGTVDFRDGATLIVAAVPLSGNPLQATCSTSALTVGTHTITATYNGDANNNVASGTESFTVNSLGYSVWSGLGGDNAWSTAANWLYADVPALSGATVRFDGSTRTSPNLDNNYAVAALTFNSTAAASFNLTATAGKTLAAAGIANNSSYDQTISANVSQGSTLLVVETGTRQILLSGDVEGDAGYTVNGSGTLYLNNTANGIGGPVIVNSGATLRLADCTDFGANDGIEALTLNGGTVRNDDTHAGKSFLYWATPCTLDAGGGTFNMPGSGVLIQGDGSSYNGTTLHQGPPITGPGKLTKTGTGSLILTNTQGNSFEGGLLVKEGQVIVKMDNNLGSGDVTVASGATFELTAPTQFPATSKLLLQAGSPSVKLTYSGVNTVAQLSIDGGATFQAPGTWGSPTSGAAHTDSRFSGTGQIDVTTGPTSLPTPVASFGITNVGDGTLTLGYAGGTGARFVLLQTNNLTAPLTDWTRLQTNPTSPGTFTITPGSDPAEFYRVQSE